MTWNNKILYKWLYCRKYWELLNFCTPYCRRWISYSHVSFGVLPGGGIGPSTLFFIYCDSDMVSCNHKIVENTSRIKCTGWRLSCKNNCIHTTSTNFTFYCIFWKYFVEGFNRIHIRYQTVLISKRYNAWKKYGVWNQYFQKWTAWPLAES